MAKVEVRDRMIWTRHIHGDADLAQQLESLPTSRTVRMRVAGKSGLWEKVNAPALRPVGDELRTSWRKLFETKHGTLVDISLEEPANDWRSGTDADRDAAWAAFMALTKAGWRSEEEVPEGGLQRDDLHQR